MEWMFIGSIGPEDESLTKEGSVAGTVTQNAIIQGLSIAMSPPMSVISMRPRRIFPIGNFTQKYEFLGKVNYLSYINLPIIKQITFSLNSAFQVFRKRKSLKFVLSYNAGLFNFLPLQICKFYKIKVGLIVHDVIVPRRNVGNSWLARIDMWCLKNLGNKCDISFPISKSIQEDFFKNTNSIVIEGGIPEKTKVIFLNQNQRRLDKNAVHIVFAGGLNFQNGISEILDAISMIASRSLRFHFFGKGPLSKNVISASNSDDRIVFHGAVDHESVLDYIKNKSDILLNIRMDEDISTKYFFPSKLIEYLSSGIPTISSTFTSLLPEYIPYILVSSESSRSIADSIENMIKNYEYHQNIAKKAQIWSHENKSWQFQSSVMAKSIFKLF